MPKLFVSLVILLLLVLTVLAAKPNNQVPDNLYSRFKQSDYNMTFEWGEVISVTKPEVTDLKVRIFKFNRTCAAVNFTMEFDLDLGNDMEVIVQSYKFASNEYRLFPLRIQINFCKGVASNLIGTLQAYKCGTFKGCPLLRGVSYHVCNWTPDESQFPPLMPTGRYMLEFQGLYRNKELFVVRGYGTVSRRLVKK